MNLPTESLPENALEPAEHMWLMEIGGWIVFAVVAIALIINWRKNGRPSVAALLFIACLTMFWQEFYADWGAYLYYNPDLALLPWGDTPYTTPNKPVYVIAGYGWFYAGAFPAILLFFRWFRNKWPSTPYLVGLALTAWIPFYLWNALTADAASAITHWYEYLERIGPEAGKVPLLYPAVPFTLFAPWVIFSTIFATAAIVSLDRRDDTGRTWFERLGRVPATITSVKQRTHQIAIWIVGFNVMYAICLTIPLVLIRILFLSDNPYVPAP